VRGGIRQGDERRADVRADALPLKRLPRRREVLPAPPRKESRFEESAVIVLLGACVAVALFDVLLMLEHIG